jgi:prepilin-type N-terminal cleavage/methylation domain-containing protein
MANASPVTGKRIRRVRAGRHAHGRRRRAAGIAGWMRHDEAGFTLVELMMALFIMVIAAFALAQLTSSALLATLKTREREVGVALANQTIESIRANGYANIALNTGAIPPPPATYLDDDGTTYTTLRLSCGTCLAYQTTDTTHPPFTFTVRRIVIGVDDPADGVGAGAGGDKDGVLVDYKKVVVEVQAPSGAAGAFLYKVETIVHDATKDPVTQVQGIRMEIHDANGDLVDDDTYDWTISVDPAGINNEPVNEGVYQNFALDTGSYTCTVTITANSQDWFPLGFPNATSDTFACNVTAGTIATIARNWDQRNVCLVDPAQTGKLWVEVIDSTGGPITTATVDPAPTGGQTPDPAQQTVNSNGDAVFDGIPIGPYNVVVAANTYDPATTTACVHSVDPPAPLLVTLTKSQGGPHATVTVDVKYTGAGTKTYLVALEQGGNQIYVLTNSVGHNLTVVYTFQPVFGTYDVKVYCQVNGGYNLKFTKANQAYTMAITYDVPVSVGTC